MEEDQKEKRHEEHSAGKKEEGRYREQERHGGGRLDGGVVISKRTLWYAAGGALGALALIGAANASNRIRPAVVGAVKEGYAFKEWLAGKVDKVKEDVEDIVAEAKYAHHKDVEASAEAVKREKDVLQKVEETLEKKAGRKKAEKEE
jgi:hypothetical protein